MSRLQRQAATHVLVLLSLAVRAAPAYAESCDGACLRKIADRYLDALVQHDARRLPLADQVRFTENSRELALDQSLWQHASAVGNYRQYFADVAAGNALVTAVVDESGMPAILAARLKVSDCHVTEIETVVARKGSHPLFTPELLQTGDPLFASPVPKERRSSRARMIAIANAYFDGIERHSSQSIPATPDCDRFENGTKMTFRTPSSGNCAKSADNLTYIKAVQDRRYFIVDEVTGVVACSVLFDIPGGDPLPANQGSSANTPLQNTLRNRARCC
jgi:hypothetical protein